MTTIDFSIWEDEIKDFQLTRRDEERKEIKTSNQCYLIHFTKPYKHARHYLGQTSIGVKNRMKAHVNSPGPLLRAVKNNGGLWVVSRVWHDTERGYEAKLKKRRGTEHCPFCRRGNMGEYVSVKRTCVDGKCKWCGNKKRQMFAYNGDGPFCNKDCVTSYWGVWPYEISFNQPLPIEYVRANEILSW